MSRQQAEPGNLAWGTESEDLRNVFEQYGVVTDAIVLKDRETNRSRGFGFVTFDSTDAANAAVEDMNEKDFNGRNIRVNLATDKPARERY